MTFGKFTTTLENMTNSQRMKSIILVFFVLELNTNSYGQFAFNNIEFELKNSPTNLYRIIQTRDGATTKVEEFDRAGRQVFQYIQGIKLDMLH